MLGKLFGGALVVIGSLACLAIGQKSSAVLNLPLWTGVFIVLTICAAVGWWRSAQGRSPQSQSRGFLSPLSHKQMVVAGITILVTLWSFAKSRELHGLIVGTIPDGTARVTPDVSARAPDFPAPTPTTHPVEHSAYVTQAQARLQHEKLRLEVLQGYIVAAERMLKFGPIEIADLEETRAWLTGLRESGFHGPPGSLPAYLELVSPWDRKLQLRNREDRSLSLRVAHVMARGPYDRCKLTFDHPSSMVGDEPFRIGPGATVEFESTCLWRRGDWLEMEVGGPDVPPGWISDSLFDRRIGEIDREIASIRERMSIARKQVQEFSADITRSHAEHKGKSAQTIK